MKAIGKYIFLTLLGLLLASNAFAYPQLAAGLNNIEFINFETASGLVDGQIAEGTILYGVIRAQAISDANADVVWSSGSGDYLTGFFASKVTGVSDVTVVNGEIHATLTFSALTADDLATLSPQIQALFSSQDIADQVVMKLFTDTATPLTNAGTEAQSIASATDGSLWMNLSLDGGYWWSSAIINPDGLATGDTLATNWFGFNLADGGAITSLPDINDPLETRYDTDVDIYGNSKITKQPVGPWSYESNDPATLATPEPGTFLILGAGLLGLAAFRRKFSN